MEGKTRPIDALMMKLECMRVFETLGHRRNFVKLGTLIELREQAAKLGICEDEVKVSVARGMLRSILREGTNAEKARRAVAILPMQAELGIEKRHFDSAQEELNETAEAYYQPAPHF